MVSSDQIIDFLVAEFSKALPPEQADVYRGILQRLVWVAHAEQVQRIEEDLNRVESTYQQFRRH